MAKEKTDWTKWLHEKIGEHPVDSNKFGMFAWEYAFYRGDQYRFWDEKLGFLREVNVNREARCIYNVCRPIVNLFVAKMLKDDPEPRFRPYIDNTEDSDRNIAAVGNGMSQFWWKTEVEGSVRLRHQAQWGGITGIGIGKIYWDKDKRSGNYIGGVDWETVNPFHFFCNPDARRDEEMRWVIHRFPQEKSVVEERFGLPTDTLKADEKSEIEEKRISGGKKVDDYVSAVDKECVFVHDIWIKACKEYPNGKHVVVAGSKELVNEDNTEPDMLPFFTFRVKSLPDEFYGDGMLKDILVIQRDMNRLASITQGNAAYMANSKWLVKRSSGILKSALNNEEMEVVEYDDEAPKRDQGMPVPEQIVNLWWDNWRKIQLITGFQDANMGMIPYRGSQTSPGVIKELKQSEDVVFAQDIAEMTDYVRRVMKRYFFLMRKYCPEPRMVEVLGDNKMPEIMYFYAQDYIKEPDFDITIGSGFSQSQEARMDQMIQFAQTGLFQLIPGFDWNTFGEEVMEYAGLNKLKENTYIDTRQARRNLEILKQGQKVMISRFWNFAAHFKFFTDFIKKPEYDALQVEQKAAIEGHLMDLMMMMAPPQGVPVGSGGPPMTGPGNQMPQQPTATEQAGAAQNRRMAQGQPGAQNMEQAGEPALPGV